MISGKQTKPTALATGGVVPISYHDEQQKNVTFRFEDESFYSGLDR